MAADEIELHQSIDHWRPVR